MKDKFFDIFQEPEASSAQKEQDELFGLWEELDALGQQNAKPGRIIKFPQASIWKFVNVAALILISIALGIFAERWMFQPSVQDEILTGLGADFSIQRIRSIQSIDHNELSRETVINSLLQILNTDENDNVRLATLDVLNPIMKDDQVRIEVIRSITLQPSALVQVNILRSVIEHGSDNDFEELKFLLENDQTAYMTKERIQKLLKI